MSPTKASTSEEPLDLLLRELELELDRELDELVDREPPLNDSPPPGRADKNVSRGTDGDPSAASVAIADVGFVLLVVDGGAARTTVEKAVTTKASKSRAHVRPRSSRRPACRCNRRERVRRLMRAARPGVR
jgi:hypothetical protein